MIQKWKRTLLFICSFAQLITSSNVAANEMCRDLNETLALFPIINDADFIHLDDSSKRYEQCVLVSTAKVSQSISKLIDGIKKQKRKWRPKEKQKLRFYLKKIAQKKELWRI